MDAAAPGDVPVGKKYTIEAFIELKKDENMTSMVKIKYLEHDKCEWQKVSYMKSELTKSTFNKFMKQLTEA